MTRGAGEAEGAMIHIPIPIPIGVKRVAVVHGTAWKLVLCEGCQQPYAYRLDLEARGEDIDLLFLDGEGSAERARNHAQENLQRKSDNCVLPIPCPNCGLYQAEMARRLRDEKSVNLLQVAGGIVAFFVFLPFFVDTAYAWALAIVLAVVGLSLLCFGYRVAARFDPNAGDPESRKAIGQKNAVWGDKLAEVVRASEAAGDAAGIDKS